jgi:hypothetical protein
LTSAWKFYVPCQAGLSALPHVTLTGKIEFGLNSRKCGFVLPLQQGAELTKFRANALGRKPARPPLPVIVKVQTCRSSHMRRSLSFRIGHSLSYPWKSFIIFAIV